MYHASMNTRPVFMNSDGCISVNPIDSHRLAPPCTRPIPGIGTMQSKKKQTRNSGIAPARYVSGLSLIVNIIPTSPTAMNMN